MHAELEADLARIVFALESLEDFALIGDHDLWPLSETRINVPVNDREQVGHRDIIADRHEENRKLPRNIISKEQSQTKGLHVVHLDQKELALSLLLVCARSRERDHVLKRFILVPEVLQLKLGEKVTAA